MVCDDDAREQPKGKKHQKERGRGGLGMGKGRHIIAWRVVMPLIGGRVALSVVWSVGGDDGLMGECSCSFSVGASVCPVSPFGLVVV